MFFLNPDYFGVRLLHSLRSNNFHGNSMEYYDSNLANKEKLAELAKSKYYPTKLHFRQNYFAYDQRNCQRVTLLQLNIALCAVVRDGPLFF